MVKAFLARIKSRKLWVTVIVMTVATVELHLGHLASPDWVTVLQTLIPAWLASHAVQESIAAFVDRKAEAVLVSEPKPEPK